MDIGEIIYGDTSDVLFDEDSIGTKDADGAIHRRFHDSTGLGFDAAICQAADASKYKNLLNKLRLGKLIYIFNAIKLIFSLKPAHITITIDGRSTVYDRSMLFVCMNNNYEGGGFNFCPDAKNNDGILDICIGTPAKNMDFFKIFPTAYNGKHTMFDFIHTDKGKLIHVVSDSFEWVHTDGEVKCKSKEITIRLLPEQIKLLM
jgi:diacylglycerol kinase family enzyme